MLRVALLLVLLASGLPAAAQVQGQAPASPEGFGHDTLPRQPALAPLQVLRGKGPLTRRIVFVVDTSGSMKGEKTAQAIQSVLLILGQPLDELQIACVAFADANHAWEGLPDPCAHASTDRCRHCLPAQGWARLPDDRPDGALARFMAFLNGRFEDGGNTNASGALSAALDVERDELSIVFVSDGDFVATDDVAGAVKRGQERRKKKGLAPARIMVWGAGKKARDQEGLKAVARLGEGGFWVHGEAICGPW